MKIKTKKVMTEKEYLHYVIDNTDLLSISHDFTHVDHDIVHSDIVLELHDRNNTTCANTWVNSEGETVFEVDIEEDLTEDTKIPKMLVLDNDGSTRLRNNHCASYFNSIDTKALYMMNDDMTMTLIWKNGRLVK